jgi:hypothetical protein
VGYYGDSTTSQHGFIYNTHTGQYTFLDDPSEAFDNGVEVTQITGINNSGEITGFYTDANGVFHSFVATPSGLAHPHSSVALATAPSTPTVAKSDASSVNLPTTGVQTSTRQSSGTGQVVGKRQHNSGSAGTDLSVKQVGKNTRSAAVGDGKSDLEIWRPGHRESVTDRLLLK